VLAGLAAAGFHYTALSCRSALIRPFCSYLVHEPWPRAGHEMDLPSARRRLAAPVTSPPLKQEEGQPGRHQVKSLKRAGRRKAFR